jgi:hypothetical protein
VCKIVLEAERGDDISVKVWDMYTAWQATLPGKAGEGLKRVVSSLGRYNWINKGKMVASGRADIRPFGYREGTATVKVVEMFKAVEAIAYNYGWSINFLTQTILSGATLDKEPRAKLEVAKAADNKVLSDWEYPLEGDILAALLKYYQVRYVVAVLLGKPVRELVVSLWINRTNWEEDTPQAKHARYMEVRDLHFQKQSHTPQVLINELTISTQSSRVGSGWMSALTNRLEFLEDSRGANGLAWELTYEVIDEAALKLREDAMLEIQRLQRTSGGSRGRGTRTINALVHDSAGEGAGPSREAERPRSASPYGGSQSSGGSGNAMNFCTGCRCKHLEPGGPGVCPWRKTDTAGKPSSTLRLTGGTQCILPPRVSTSGTLWPAGCLGSRTPGQSWICPSGTCSSLRWTRNY